MSLGMALIAAAGCGSSEPPTIDRETFVATFVELRARRVVGDGGDPGRRAAVLETRGVSEEELLRFVEVHGDDVVFMRDVWDEVERRMSALDETGAAPPDAEENPDATTEIDPGAGR